MPINDLWLFFCLPVTFMVRHSPHFSRQLYPLAWQWTLGQGEKWPAECRSTKVHELQYINTIISFFVVCTWYLDLYIYKMSKCYEHSLIKYLFVIKRYHTCRYLLDMFNLWFHLASEGFISSVETRRTNSPHFLLGIILVLPPELLIAKVMHSSWASIHLVRPWVGTMYERKAKIA